MKLKYKFEIIEAGGQMMAAAVGEDAEKFPGMIGLNESAKEIFVLLYEDITEDEIVKKLTEKFSTPEDILKERIHEYLEQLAGVGALE